MASLTIRKSYVTKIMQQLKSSGHPTKGKFIRTGGTKAKNDQYKNKK